jgi:uracil-DNA glycosylase
MQKQGDLTSTGNSLPGMSIVEDQIREKYLERAIRELNLFSREVSGCEWCNRGNVMPVVGAGHPQADVMLVKYGPRPSEVEEGVAFYGRAGNALMKSLKRLDIDPLLVYGTLCVKCPLAPDEQPSPQCVARLLHELAIIQPKIVVIMGEHALGIVNGLDVPLGLQVDAAAGVVQQLTPTVAALFTPDIDNALDDEEAKRSFWQAFRVLGDWYKDFPPY